ncbi:hypothetical protein [Modestobacter sp. NPDC049651]|uniref:hypothetical protein n=1 Tax=unclassified Modestobacter TaxID=2643866 RepID=UPI0033D34A2C
MVPQQSAPAATVVLPPLDTAEVRLLYAAVHLFRSLVRHAAAYDDANAVLRRPVLDVRADVLLRFPPRGAGGRYVYPPLTAEEGRFVRLALANLADGLGHLGRYGDPAPDPGAPGRLLARITAVPGLSGPTGAAG